MEIVYVILGLVSPCIIIHSNKSTNQMHQSLRFMIYSERLMHLVGWFVWMFM